MATSYNSNTDLINGNSIMIYVGSNPIAFGKSCDLSIKRDEIDTSNKMSGHFKSALAGKISWTVTSDFLYTNVTGDTSFDTLASTILGVGGTVSIVIGTTTDSTTFAMSKGLYSGTAIITDLSLKAENDSIASCSISLSGTGALTPVPAA